MFTSDIKLPVKSWIFYFYFVFETLLTKAAFIWLKKYSKNHNIVIYCEILLSFTITVFKLNIRMSFICKNLINLWQIFSIFTQDFHCHTILPKSFMENKILNIFVETMIHYHSKVWGE